MPAPIILAVDDDPEVLHALRRDLKARYDDRTRVLTAHSGDAAIDLLDHLGRGRHRVAVLVVDHDMARMSGIEFLREVGDRAGDARRVLLHEFGEETEVAAAMGDVAVAHTVVKPWDPADTRLYPVLDDLLADWIADHGAPEDEVRVVGHRWARDSHELKDFLGRNQVPFRFLDLDRGRDAHDLLAHHRLEGARLPVVLLPGGDVLEEPSIEDLAGALEMHTHASTGYYDLAIVGAGPAGLAAAVYGGSEGLSTVLVEREAPGGQAGTSSRIENYLGFPTGISGADLARRAVVQAERFGVEVLAPQRVERLSLEGGYKVLTLGDGSTISARALVVATGVTYRTLDTAGLERLSGAGVYYGAATTEALAAEGEHVYVVGSANSAGQGAMYFSRFAERVTMVVRGPDLSEHMSEYLIQQIAATDGIEVRPGSRVVEAIGTDHLEALRIEDVASGTVETVPARFLFLFIGAEPRNEWLGGQLATDEHGYLLAGPDLMANGRRPDGWRLERDPYHLETSIPGVFVAGDARHGSIRRVAGAVGEGSTCVQLVHRYLANG